VTPPEYNVNVRASWYDALCERFGAKPGQLGECVVAKADHAKLLDEHKALQQENDRLRQLMTDHYVRPFDAFQGAITSTLREDVEALEKDMDEKDQQVAELQDDRCAIHECIEALTDRVVTVERKVPAPTHDLGKEITLDFIGVDHRNGGPRCVVDVACTGVKKTRCMFRVGDTLTIPHLVVTK